LTSIGMILTEFAIFWLFVKFRNFLF